MPNDVAYIANITEQSWIAQRTYGTFQVRGCPTRSTGLQPVDEQRPTSSTGYKPVPQTGSTGLQPVDEQRPTSSTGYKPVPQVGTTGLQPVDEQRPEKRGATDGVPYALTPITARNGTIDLGDKRVLDFPISAREIAEDIAREINSDAGDASYFGVFVCAGDAPTAEELTAARARLTEYYRRLVAQADQDWERAHNWLMITDVERRAARWLGLEKEWSYEPKPLVECPACAEKLKPGVAVCKSCGAVLDAEKAARFGFAPATSSTPSPAASPAPSATPPSVAAGLSSAGFQPAGLRAEDEDQERRRAAGATDGTLNRAATQTQVPQTRPREGKRS